MGGKDGSGTKLKSASGWSTGSGYIAGTDSYGFSALPGGENSADLNFNNALSSGFWWLSTMGGNTTHANYLFISHQRAKVDCDYSIKYNGLSVRCVRN